MKNIVSFWDGREIEFRSPEVLDNFGSVVGFSFKGNSGKVDVAMSAAEVTRILQAVMEFEKRKDNPNQNLLSNIEDTCDELMEEGIELLAKCVIAHTHAKIIPDPPADLDEFI